MKMSLMGLFGRSSGASTEKLLDAEIARLENILEDYRKEREFFKREAQYWKERFMTVMGLGDMSYPGGLVGGPAQEVPEEVPQEPSHVSLISLRARHELESKRKAREQALARGEVKS